MNRRRLLVLAMIASVVIPTAACEDTTTPQPPDPPAQIKTEIHFTKTVDSQGQQTGLQSDDVYSMLVSSVGALWVGNQAGVAVYDNPSSTTRAAAFDQNNGLPNPKVRHMIEHGGKIYVATWGGGIGVYDVAGGTWSVLRETDGLVNDEVSRIKVHNDKLYISTIGGVSAYDPVANSWESYTRNSNEAVTGDLLDAYVSTLEVADTPRGTEYWYCPRWETGIDPGKEGQHGITVARNDFNASRITVRLQALRDNTLYEDDAGAISNGGGTRMLVGTSTSTLKEHHGVIKFDIASAGIPQGAVIASASLRMSVVVGTSFRTTVSLHRALAEWGEGTSVATGDETAGAPSTDGDATWLHSFYPGSLWNNAGGDRVLDPSANATADTPKRVTWTGANLAADVTSWFKNPSSNHGWVLVGDGELKSLATREHATVTLRPELEIVYAEYTYYTVLNSDLPAPNVNDIFYDAGDDLFWIALSTEGLATIDVGNATWTKFTAENNLPSDVVYSIAKVNGAIWVGTQNGVARHLGDGTFQGYNEAGGLPANRVRKVYSDDGQRLWLGFVDAGAARVNPVTAE